MSLVFGDGTLGQVQNSTKGVPNSIRDGNIVGTLVPDRQDVLLVADGDDCAADLLAHHELLAEHGHDQVLPAPRGQTLAQSDDPLAAETVGLVLPQRLDALLKHVEVGVRVEVAWLPQVAVEHPKLLDRRKRSDKL